MAKGPFDRVSNVLVRCQESATCKHPQYVSLDDSREYCVITSDFTAEGGDAFEMIRDEKINQTFLGQDIGELLLFLQGVDYKRQHKPSDCRLLSKISVRSLITFGTKKLVQRNSSINSQERLLLVYP